MLVIEITFLGSGVFFNLVKIFWKKSWKNKNQSC